MTMTTEEMPLLTGPEAMGAAFSECRKYRYSLWRRWGESTMAAFIGLNPSTADETQDDPTIRRCIAFAKRWNCGGLVMLNLFAFRATDPNEMKRETDPVGPLNDKAIRVVTHLCSPVVCCWGAHGGHHNRSSVVLGIVGRLNTKHLGLTKAGQPKHPLYLAADTELQGWS